MSRTVMLRGLLALALLVALASVGQAYLVERLLGPWRQVIEILEPDFRVVQLHSGAANAEPVIALVVAPARAILLGGRAIVADASAQADSSTPRGAVWLLLSVFLTTLAAWPLQRPAREGPLRLVFGLPVLACLLLLDVPITLLGPLRAVLVDALSPGDWDAWTVGSQFLRGGGRCLLALLSAAAVCIAIQASARHKGPP